MLLVIEHKESSGSTRNFVFELGKKEEKLMKPFYTFVNISTMLHLFKR